MNSGKKWQRLTKARRAKVYRAIGRAARDARESGDPEVAADVRIVIDLLRAHARVSRARAARARTTARPRRRRA